ncbi:Tuftelin-interacting protein TIP39, contains G-patch domain [Ceraceosorus bombacis]|uniref:Tuftelin-interacting protein TIP39, contains G-patch domain n=1 Tax=Ceraceosorus bombacis TaxID=401625 RepID=A0A0P1BK44_9BASI|nr:Tuftelin-interacting protein TIP39, contains G-patch domain [Ceraceosorus bombacis]
MARKRYLVDQLSDSGDEGAASGSETEGRSNDRRPTRSKEEAIYGVFAESDDEQGHPGGGGRGGARGKASGRGRGTAGDYSRGQAFVSATSNSTLQAAQQARQGRQGTETGRGESSSRSSAHSDSDESRMSTSSEHHSQLLSRPLSTEEELSTRPAFQDVNLGPTAAEADIISRSAAQAQRNEGDSSFVPASFLSSRSREPAETSASSGSRGGIGSNSRALEDNGWTAPSGSSRGGMGMAGRHVPPPRKAAPLNDDVDMLEEDQIVKGRAGLPGCFDAPPKSPAPLLGASVSHSSAATPASKRSFVGGGGLGHKARSANSPADMKPIAPGKGGKFASMMMQQMGWAGGGLGKAGEGIVNPIEAVSSDSEGEDKQRKGGRKKQGKPSRNEAEHQDRERRELWSRPDRKMRRVKVQHRTYEEIIAEAGGNAPSGLEAGIGPIIDATGPQVREVASLSSALGDKGIPTSESTRLPELRHNLRLICDNNRILLEGLARKGAQNIERQKWLVRERDESERRRAKAAVDARRVREVLSVVRDLEELGIQNEKLVSSRVEEEMDTQRLSDLIGLLKEKYGDEIQGLGLDEAIVAAVVPFVRTRIRAWKPLQEPRHLLEDFEPWHSVLQSVDESRHATMNGHSKSDPLMTPFESLLWHLWMPPVRSALNNDWKAHHPEGAMRLLEAWQPFLPRFIFDNLTNQIILPRLSDAVEHWEMSSSKAPLHAYVFPWLEVMGEQMTDLMNEARRRVRAVLRSWRASSGLPEALHLEKWREVFQDADWNAMLLDQVVPKLSSYLRQELRINPAKQEMRPFHLVLAWHIHLAPINTSRLLESDFFPQWLDVLHLWLTQPKVQFSEVGQWYSFWKAQFAKYAGVQELPGIKLGFKRGLDLINQALEQKTAEGRASLPKADSTPLSKSQFKNAQQAHSANAPSNFASRRGAAADPARASANAESSITFKRVVEEEAAKSELLVLPLSKSHPLNGAPLLRISPHITGKPGITFYIDDDVVWAAAASDAADQYSPISLQELVQSAKLVKK